ncbi:hypothetical protein HETIRDRAFT_409213 [Heterobasidion irregulare TC 32-1]|uniref:Uncharacterized protein n=1 Tax=Heterobasidion irregulare (strain TC 32-1) TaxID=747525 RepID=W4KC17_HETIT|nr:uncharacterized protein HETIRDRAFT_409213 [Heterobasidion irregulare TC 32-1]ETW83417.1 hypothetical protein HETIRDRAFT_409213 [Heterobasidion irregulare TC 32-1]
MLQVFFDCPYPAHSRPPPATRNPQYVHHKNEISIRYTPNTHHENTRTNKTKRSKTKTDRGPDEPLLFLHAVRSLPGADATSITPPIDDPDRRH